MARQRYSAPFKEQALALVARQDKPASVIAQEPPLNTRHDRVSGVRLPATQLARQITTAVGDATTAALAALAAERYLDEVGRKTTSER